MIVTVQDEVAVVLIDNPPVNALAAEVRAQLAATLHKLAADPAVRALVITGVGRTFVAGADIRELEAAVWNHAVEPPDFHGLLALVEDSTKPVVMALNGAALGGGLELAMAGHYRIAAPGARLGLPEVNLGIIPGAEGTQRLTRLVGVAKALEMCVSGRPVDADDARRAGLVDLVAEDDLRETALAFARDALRRGQLPHARAGGQARRPQALQRGARRRSARDRAQTPPPPDGPARGDRRDRGCGQPALRGGLPARADAVARLRALGAGARDGLRLPGRADERQGAGRLGDTGGRDRGGRRHRCGRWLFEHRRLARGVGKQRAQCIGQLLLIGRFGVIGAQNCLAIAKTSSKPAVSSRRSRCTDRTFRSRDRLKFSSFRQFDDAIGASASRNTGTLCIESARARLRRATSDPARFPRRTRC